VLHHDVNRRVGHNRVVPEVRIVVDRSRDAVPELVVELRHRQHADLILDAAHAVDAGDPLLDVVALERHRHFTGQRHDPVHHICVHIVEDRELRVSLDRLGDVLRDLEILPLRLADRTGERQVRREQQTGGTRTYRLEHVAPPLFRKGKCNANEIAGQSTDSSAIVLLRAPHRCPAKATPSP
jgi:hypothetical protein